MMSEFGDGKPRSDARESRAIDLDQVDAVMQRGDASQLLILKEQLLKQGLSVVEFENAVEAQRLRHEVHKRQREAVRRRVNENPIATAEELALGAYNEQIEPQVRDAIRALNAKGYTSHSSGFSSFDFQSINFAEPYFVNLASAVRKQLHDRGVIIKDKNLSLHAEKADLDAIRKRWNAIAALLPDRGEPANSSTTPAAESFRSLFDQAGQPLPGTVDRLKQRYSREIL